jgi:hypothetical protein
MKLRPARKIQHWQRMNQSCPILLALFLAAFNTIAADNPAAGLKPIFNGTNLDGWKVPGPNPFWKVVDGVLLGENNEALDGHVLFTEKSYTNFVIELEARWSGEIDSGIMLRAPELQLQFGISRSLKRDMTGSFYLKKSSFQKIAEYPSKGQSTNADKVLKPDGWNKFRLEARGNIFTVWINGEQTVKFECPGYDGGAPVGLQIHPKLKMKVEYRNIRARELE